MGENRSVFTELDPYSVISYGHKMLIVLTPGAIVHTGLVVFLAVLEQQNLLGTIGQLLGSITKRYLVLY